MENGSADAKASGRLGAAPPHPSLSPHTFNSYLSLGLAGCLWGCSVPHGREGACT